MVVALFTPVINRDNMSKFEYRYEKRCGIEKNVYDFTIYNKNHSYIYLSYYRESEYDTLSNGYGEDRLFLGIMDHRNRYSNVYDHQFRFCTNVPLKFGVYDYKISDYDDEYLIIPPSVGLFNPQGFLELFDPLEIPEDPIDSVCYIENEEIIHKMKKVLGEAIRMAFDLLKHKNYFWDEKYNDERRMVPFQLVESIKMMELGPYVKHIPEASNLWIIQQKFLDNGRVMYL